MELGVRLLTLKARALRSYQGPDPKAEALYQESLVTTEGEPDVIRHAKAFAHYCLRQDLSSYKGELIFGTRPGQVTHAEVMTPAVFGRREWTAPTLWWPVPEEVHPHWCEGLLAPAGNHTTLDYETVLDIGFPGLIARIEERLAQLAQDKPDDTRQRDFLLALRIVAEGHLALCARYAEEADAQALLEDNLTRQAELQTIAANCRHALTGPPESFWEACQAVWFAFYFLPDAPGRVDQYLWPAYERDLARGAITPEFAFELLCCLWVKYYETVGAASGVSAHNHLTLGGQRPDGTDGANPVTLLCLDVVEYLGLPRPQVGVRWYKGTPQAVIERATRALRGGTGSPDFCSDEQIVPALERIGVAREDARDFSLSGCHEVIVTGKAQMGSVEGFVNMPKLLLMALGLEPVLQQDVDLTALDSFEALWASLVRAMELTAEAAHISAYERDKAAAADPGGNLPASLVVADCIEKGLGYTHGGARYNFCNWNIIGTANLVDSLVALRRLVFDAGELTLQELVDALASNWEGHEELHRRMLQNPEPFGNEASQTDTLMARVVETFDSILKRYTPFRGGVYILGTTAGGENMHIEFGRITGATPDGRCAGDPVADSIGAAQGRDKQGVTALLNSVSALPHKLLPTATTLNVKLDPKLLTGEEGIAKVAALIRSHFETGGQQLQFAFVTRELLEEAKAQPELHRNLMVRVAGYSAPFTSLWGDLQDEIIARTEHCL